MITEKELELLRAEQNKLLPETGDIKRRNFQNGLQGDFEFWSRNNPCRLTPGFGVWRESADRFQGITAFTLTLPWGTDIKAGDKIIVGSRTFEVRDALIPKSYDTAVRVLLDLVTD